MRVHPGRTRSVIGGIMMLLVMIVGLVMMLNFGGPNRMILPFLFIWVIIGLGGAAASFYNAFSKRGLPLYEVESDDEQGSAFCPQCGRPIAEGDRYCKHCGASLDE